MKSKVLTAAVSAALMVVPMAAVAGVKIGGMAQGEIGYWKDSSNGVVKSQGTNMLDNGRGRLWIEADQKLGYGLTGMAYYMLKINTVGGSSAATGIDQSPYAPGTDAGEKYVGLKGGFGSIELGNIASPYKYTGGVMWDAFVTTDLQARGNGGMSAGVFGQNGFMSNSILYQSPDFSGFHVAFAYSPMNAGVNGSNAANKLTAQHGDYAGAVQWKALGWSIFVARDHASAPAGDQTFKPYAAPIGVGNGLVYAFPAGGKPGSTSGVAQNNTKFGVKYDFGPVALMGQVENLQTSGEANPTRDYFLGVDGNAGHWAPALQVGETTDKYFVGTDIKVSYIAVGTFYNFKKGFSLYGGYRRTHITGASSAAAIAAGASNGTQSVFSIGMRKVF
ncbi:porin [Acidiferrobacter sp.]|uniref:porin n=1 Tax=Acidiferrobacter sp. TaxID=1872107 RepID=UPI002603FE91|nr:porin [Acidiferrobacter sp.]